MVEYSDRLSRNTNILIKSSATMVASRLHDIYIKIYEKWKKLCLLEKEYSFCLLREYNIICVSSISMFIDVAVNSLVYLAWCYLIYLKVSVSSLYMMGAMHRNIYCLFGHKKIQYEYCNRNWKQPIRTLHIKCCDWTILKYEFKRFFVLFAWFNLCFCVRGVQFV